MENEMIERVARAIQGELRRQKHLYEFDEDEDLSRLMMSTGASADLPAVVRAAIEAMREPTHAMFSAAPPTHGKDAAGSRIELLHGAPVIRGVR